MPLDTFEGVVGGKGAIELLELKRAVIESRTLNEWKKRAIELCELNELKVV